MALLVGQALKEKILNVTYYLKAGLLVVIVESHKKKSGAVYGGAGYLDLFGESGQIYAFKRELIYYL
jgi:hypothetical protein